MSPTCPPPAEARGVVLPVRWDRAAEAHARVRRAGCPATLCLDPAAREARLELWPGADPGRARAALGGLAA